MLNISFPYFKSNITKKNSNITEKNFPEKGKNYFFNFIGNYKYYN